MIRIIGYTYFLSENQIEVDFYNPYDLPEVFKKKVNYIKFNIPFGLIRLLKYYCLSPKLLFFLKYVINFYPLIKELEKINNPIIFHQDFKLGLFLTLKKKKKYIFDVHGILNLQKEYLDDSTFKNKVNFYIKLITERNYFKFGKYFITTSKEMKYFLKNRYKINLTNIFIAEEALLNFYREDVNKDLEKYIRKKYNILKNDKIILFAGDFKKFGGVLDLIRAFWLVHKNKSNTKLILIGSGQEEKKLKQIIEIKNLKNSIILTGRVDYKILSTYQSISDIIVCPDKKNLYNEITTHIKVYDSLASGKPVVFSRLRCLNEKLKSFRGIEFFEPGNIEDLAEKIIKIIQSYQIYLDKASYNKEEINNFTYQKNTEKLISQMVKKSIL